MGGRTAARRRPYRIAYSSASLAGQLAAVESSLAVAVLTRCSMPPSLQQLDHGLPALPSLEVAVVRSRASAGSGAVDALHEQALRTLRRSA